MYHPTITHPTPPSKPTIILHLKINRDHLPALSLPTSPPALQTTPPRLLHPNPSPIQVNENKTTNCRLRARYITSRRLNQVITPTKRPNQIPPTKRPTQAPTPTKRPNQPTSTKSLPKHKQALVIFERCTRKIQTKDAETGGQDAGYSGVESVDPFYVCCILYVF